MAKQEKKSALEAEHTMSIGDQMKGKATQRDRNLAVKAELIKAGKHPKSTLAPNSTQRDRNLAFKAQLKEKENGDSKGKAKG